MVLKSLHQPKKFSILASSNWLIIAFFPWKIRVSLHLKLMNMEVSSETTKQLEQ